MMNKLTAAVALSAALLTACGSQTSSVPGNGAAQRYASVARVPLHSGDTEASVSAALGGKVLSWRDQDCAVDASGCYALVGIDRPASAISAQSLSRADVQIEPNRDVFTGSGIIRIWDGGIIRIWDGGIIRIWDGGIIRIWDGGTYSPLPENTSLWQKINLQAAQTRAPHLGDGVIVAVIDTGVDLNHPAFQGAFTDPSTWRDFYDGDNTPQEEGELGVGGYGHGTNVAGIVLQVAPNAKIMPLRALAPDGSGDVSAVAQAIDWATDHGANIINLSLGSTERSDIVQDAVDRAAAHGVLVTSSAGNSNQSQITYPAHDLGLNKMGVSVGSTDLSDHKSSFSNYGKELLLSAPGENVYAPAPDNRMASWSGTSMATPMVAGGLALALGESANPAKLAKAVIGSAQNLYSNNANDAYKNQLGSKGRLDLNAFLLSVLN